MSNENAPKLLPCPFCGGGVESIEPGGMLWRGQSYSAPQFWTLKHYGRLSEADAFPICTISIRHRTEAEAIAAWNTRAHTDDARAVRSKLKGDSHE